jgi:hypothetical protein
VTLLDGTTEHRNKLFKTLENISILLTSVYRVKAWNAGAGSYGRLCDISQQLFYTIDVHRWQAVSIISIWAGQGLAG